MKYYLLTFKTLKEQNPTPMMYMNAFEYVLTHLKQIYCYNKMNAFEFDSMGKLHFHVVVTTKYVQFKNIVKYMFEHDMYFHFVEVQEDQMHIVDNYLSKSRVKTASIDAVVQRKLRDKIEADPYPFV